MVPEMSDAPVQYGINRNEWTRTRQGQYQSPSVVRFTQRDVDNGYVWYKDQSENDDDEDESIDFTVILDRFKFKNFTVVFFFRIIKVYDQVFLI